MSDLIRREDAINALVEKGQSSKRYKLGEFWELNLSEITDAIDAIPSAEPDNQVHLCDSCHYVYPECPAMKNEVIFGNGKGHDNICACAKYIPSAEPERKWIPVAERLPLWSEHVNDMVLVCYGNGSIRFDACMNGDWVHGNPIAWMQLPEPWRGEE